MYKRNRTTTYYSVLGAYAYNKDIFKNFTLPENVEYKKADIIDYIVYDNADLPLRVVNLDILKEKIRLWCVKEAVNWERIYKALTDTYNPLHNYDRYEEATDTQEGEKHDVQTLANNVTYSYGSENVTTHGKQLTHTDDLTHTEAKQGTDNMAHVGSEVTDHSNTAFNAGLSVTSSDSTTKNLQDNETINLTTTDKNTGTYTDKNSGSDSEKHQGTDKEQHGGNIKNDGTDSGTNEHIAHLWGNIGVTTSQSMLSDEIKVRMQYNFFDIISEMFRAEFCILVY